VSGDDGHRVAASPVAVLGPTASGKSDVAMAAARALVAAGRHVEIVAVDAMQVYRGMDIGTATPGAADRAEIPHHGLDLADPADEYSVAEFVRAGRAAIEGTSARGGLPLVVAGTGLHLRALTDPMDIPGTWPELRAALQARAERDGPEALHRELAGADPVAASRMEPTNVRRIVRALEVCQGSGRPFSSFGPGIDTYPPTRWRLVGLRWPRDVLAQRIERRVAAMMAAGLLDEVRGLLGRQRPLSRTARQALGYRELIDHLEGRLTLDEAVELTVRRTRQFAVRQERWFRRDPRVQWVDIELDPVHEVVPVVLGAARA